MKILKMSPPEIYIFEENNFSVNDTVFAATHKHGFGEIHIIAEGKVSFVIDEKHYVLEKNSAVLIPHDKYHTVKTELTPLRHMAFMTNSDCHDVVIKTFPQEFIHDFFCLENSNKDICNFVFYIRNCLCPENAFVYDDTLNYELQITEFFSKYHNNKIQVQDLANELHVSPMQAQRLCKLHTGKTFGENLLIQRMKTAEELMCTTNMKLMEISSCVGYDSYSGFYKAYNKYKKQQNLLQKRQMS